MDDDDEIQDDDVCSQSAIFVLFTGELEAKSKSRAHPMVNLLLSATRFSVSHKPPNM